MKNTIQKEWEMQKYTFYKKYRNDKKAEKQRRRIKISEEISKRRKQRWDDVSVMRENFLKNTIIEEDCAIIANDTIFIYDYIGMFEWLSVKKFMKYG